MELIYLFTITVLIGAFLPMVALFIDILIGEPFGKGLGNNKAIFRFYGIWLNKKWYKHFNKERGRLRALNPDIRDEEVEEVMKPTRYLAWGLCPTCTNIRISLFLSPLLLWACGFTWVQVAIFFLPCVILSSFFLRVWRRFK